MEFFIDTAWAQVGTQPNSIISFLPLIIIFALFYFLLIRPNSKRQKEHRELVAALEKGQEVVTSGGVLGKVTEVGPTWVTVEVAADVALKVQKNNITAIMPKDTIKSA